MQAKFILHGGFASTPNEDNDKFFSEILNTEKKNPHILLVYFAKNAEDYEQIKEKDISMFEKNKNGKNLSFEIAREENLSNQIRKSDVVYLHGGKTLKLLEILKKVPNLADLFQGKTIAGESAGAYILSTYFYSKSEGGVFEGLGFAPVKTICHYIGVNSEKLDDYPQELEMLLLPDYKYKVFYRN